MALISLVANWKSPGAAAVAALLLLGGGPASAQVQRPPSDDIFTIADVPVDVTDTNAIQARERAMLDGQREAFQRLVRRLSTEATPRTPRLDEAALTRVVRSIDVADERTSGVRYLATLTVRFSPSAVREMLGTAGIAFTEIRAKPMVVLPVYVAGGSSVLFEDANPWRAIWAGRRQRNSLVPLVVPLGDLQDVGAIDASQALAGDRARLDVIARRYGASDVAVVAATARLEGAAGAPSLSVSVTRHTAVGDSTLVNSFAGEAGQIDQVLARAADWVAAELERIWKQDNAIVPGQEDRQITVSVPVEGLDEWVEIRRRLAGIGLVRKAEVLHLRRTEGRIAVTYAGELSQFKSALAQRELELGDGEEPVLKLSGPERR